MADDPENEVTIEYGARVNEASFAEAEAEIAARNAKIKESTEATTRSTSSGDSVREIERRGRLAEKNAQAEARVEAQRIEDVSKADMAAIRAMQAERTRVAREGSGIRQALDRDEAAELKRANAQQMAQLREQVALRKQQKAAEQELATENAATLRAQLGDQKRLQTEHAAIQKQMTLDDRAELVKRARDMRMAAEEQEAIQAKMEALSLASFSRREGAAKKKLFGSGRGGGGAFGGGGGRGRGGGGGGEDFIWNMGGDAEDEAEEVARGARLSSFATRRTIVEAGRVGGLGSTGTLASLAAYGPLFAAFGVIIGAVGGALYSLHAEMLDQKAELGLMERVHTLGLTYANARRNIESFHASLNSRGDAYALAGALAGAEAEGLKFGPGDASKLTTLQTARGETGNEFGKKLSAVAAGDVAAFKELTGLRANIVFDEYAASLGKLPSALSEVEKAHALMNKVIEAGANSAELAAQRMTSLDGKWTKFKATLGDFAADYGKALIAKYAFGESGEQTGQREYLEQTKGPGGPGRATSQTEYLAQIRQFNVDTQKQATEVEAKRSGLISASLQAAISGLLGYVTSDSIGGSENLAARTLATLHPNVPWAIKPQGFEDPKTPEQERQRLLEGRYAALEKESTVRMQGLDRGSRSGKTIVEQYKEAITAQAEFNSSTIGLDTNDVRVIALAESYEMKLAPAINQARSQALALQKEIEHGLSNYSNLLQLGGNNPYVKFFAEAEDAAQKAQEKYHALGDETVAVFTRLYQEEAKTHIFELKIGDTIKAMGLEFQAAQLSRPFIEMSGEIRRTTVLVNSLIETGQRAAQLTSVADKIDRVSRFRGDRLLYGTDKPFGLEGTREGSGLDLAGQEYNRLRLLKAEFGANPETAHVVDQAINKLFESMPPELKNALLHGTRRGEFADFFGGANRGEAQYQQDEVKKVLARARAEREAIDEATKEVRALQGLTTERGPAGEAKRNLLRSNILGITGAIPREELTPELLKARITALSDEAQHRRQAENAAIQMVTQGASLQKFLESRADQLLAAIAAHDQTAIIRILNESDKARTEALGPIMGEESTTPILGFAPGFRY